MSFIAAESANAPELETAGHEAAELEPADLVIALFDRYRVPLLRYIVAFRLPVQEAEEIVQEVFLALFQHLQRGRSDQELSRQNLPGWVFRVAHNLALKRRASPKFRAAAAEADGAFAIDLLGDPSPNPEDQFAARQWQQRLFGVFRALPEQDRQCLALRAEGLRYREIADVLGVSLGAVANSLTRSFARLTRASER